MAGASIRVDDAEIRAALKRFQLAGGQLNARHAIGGYLVSATHQRFISETGPDGKPWRPLRPATLRKRRRGRGNSGTPAILRDQGHLYQSITYQLSGDEIVVGSNLEYARIHQFGGTIKRQGGRRTATFRTANKGAGKDGAGSRLRFASKRSKYKRKFEKSFEVPDYTITIPARPYLGLNDEDRREILAILAEQYYGPDGAPS